MKRLKLVLSCYACEPNRGSEPGVGWAWALGMAKRHETYVLTRANNRDVIEAELARLNLPPSETPNIIYVDLSPFICRLKKRGIVPVSLYYLLWQFRARKTLDSLHLNADIIHHVTFNSFVCPGVWWNRKEKVVLGPLGGMSITPRPFMRLYKHGRYIREVFRTLVLRCWKINPFYRLGQKYADALIFIDNTTLSRIGIASKDQHVLLETAVPVNLEEPSYGTIPEKKHQFVFAGSIEPRKGWEIALRAYHQAFRGSDHPPEFKFFGSGPELDYAQKLSDELLMGPSISFPGRVTQEQLWSEIRKSKALVFPSVRDTSGNVALEAMTLQTPVICFRHQGVAEITDDECAFRVAPCGWTQAIQGFADAMQALGADSQLVTQMGGAGRRRAQELFLWGQKFEDVDRLYGKLMNSVRGG